MWSVGVLTLDEPARAVILGRLHMGTAVGGHGDHLFAGSLTRVVRVNLATGKIEAAPHTLQGAAQFASDGSRTAWLDYVQGTVAY